MLSATPMPRSSSPAGHVVLVIYPRVAVNESAPCSPSATDGVCGNTHTVHRYASGAASCGVTRRNADRRPRPPHHDGTACSSRTCESGRPSACEQPEATGGGRRVPTKDEKTRGRRSGGPQRDVSDTPGHAREPRHGLSPKTAERVRDVGTRGRACADTSRDSGWCRWPSGHPVSTPGAVEKPRKQVLRHRRRPRRWRRPVPPGSRRELPAFPCPD
jgi:hypothetical protein